MYDCIVIGAGPSGLICSIFAALNGNKVLLLEKNKICGKKLLITGKGRCNLTNNCNVEKLTESVIHNGKFLLSAFNQFNSKDTMDFFENIGVELKTERGNRVFPKSDKSDEIVNALVKYALDSGVIIKTSCCVKKLLLDDKQICGVADSLDNKYLSKKVVVATGGLSYPKTGSTGDGFKFANQAGHNIVDLKPSLVPIEIKEEFCKELMGLSLKNTNLKLYKNQKLVYEDLGEMIFTHFGISGPIVLSASCYISDYSDYTVILDFKPGLNIEQLDKRIQNDFLKYKNKNLSNSLNDLLPKKLIPLIISLSDISPYKKTNNITREERQKICYLLKNFKLSVKSLRPLKEAIITSGGVDVNEIIPKNMMSKKIKNLYFIGEVLDVDSFTGGFNLQNAFSTGYCAGINIGKD